MAAYADVTEIDAAVKRELEFNSRGGVRYRMHYRIVHKPTVTEHERGTVSKVARVSTPEVLGRIRDLLMAEVLRVRDLVRERLKARSVLDGHSLDEVVPWMDNWEHVPLTQEGRFRLFHPVSGGQCDVVFSESQLNEAKWPTELGLYQKLIERYLEGPEFCTAVAGAPGELTLGCAEVDDAVGYEWYDMTSGVRLAANGEPSATATGLAAGVYRVRALGVAGDGTEGLMSVEVQVQVT